MLRSAVLSFYFGSETINEIINTSYAPFNQVRKTLEDGNSNASLLADRDDETDSAISLDILLYILLIPLSALFSLFLSYFFKYSFFSLFLMLFLYSTFLFIYLVQNAISTALIKENRGVLHNLLSLFFSLLSLLFLFLFKNLGIHSLSLSLSGSSLITLLLTLTITKKKSFHFIKKYDSKYSSSLVYTALSALFILVLFYVSAREKRATYFANSYIIALLPSSVAISFFISTSYKRTELKKAYRYYISFISLSTLLLIAFSNEIVEVLYEGGNFYSDDVKANSAMLFYVLVSSFFMSTSIFFERILYLENEKKVIISIMLRIISALIFMFLNLSTEIIMLFSFLICLIFLICTQNFISKKEIIKETILSLSCCFPIIVYIFFPFVRIGDVADDKLSELFLSLLLGLFLFLLSLYPIALNIRRKR
ncbi:MAG TPA: hypothetical protein IAB12_01270 [Candidatus Ornithospirochaeta avicola]|uniref:Uncharacterized protein n=1 Tax=Candidatus Ornithospirochaeta avicola TaxID=2840896 RepID=A0A9D1PSG9_9SPIO|nr:hypothetical protein [Candidatus Ornithospirochaeta avicola]